MVAQPVLPTGGLVGWRYLVRTEASQSELVRRSPDISRESAHFRDRIANIETAADLVADRQLLKVALGAFGLDDDIDKRYFIRRVLEDGTIRPDAMANKLVDKRYREMSDAFGFGSPFGPRTARTAFAGDIVARYETRQFEIAVGTRDETMRLALTFRRELPVLADKYPQGDTGWLNLLGQPPLRRVMETAFGLPSSFVSLDLDRQVETLKDRMSGVLGESGLRAFSDPDNVETILTRFFALGSNTAAISSTAPGSAALSILQGGSSPGSGLIEALLRAGLQR